MRVVVTGGSGFIGRHLVGLLRARGDDVVVIDVMPSSDDDVEVIVGDIRSPAVLEQALSTKVDAVVHLAARTSVLTSVDEPEETFDVNVRGTQRLLETCRALHVPRVVLASSNAVVGNAELSVIDEFSPLQPMTPYGASKAAAEMVMAGYGASYGIVAVSLRFTNVYGPAMAGKDSIIPRLMKACGSTRRFQVYGDGEQRRDYLHVEDALRAIECALGLPDPTVLTIGSGESVSVNQLVALCEDATGATLEIEHVPARAGEMRAVVVDISKARAAGFVPTVGIREGIVSVAAAELPLQRREAGASG
jgi:UDP-glucose 4-epimerase